MFCKYCGKELPKDVKFCIKCGAEVERDLVSSKEEKPQKNSTLSSEERRKIAWIYRKALLKVLAVLIGILIVLFILLYIETKRTKIHKEQFLNQYNVAADQSALQTVVLQGK